MTPVYQEIFDSGKGDCFSACLASLLELPLATVPKFRRDNPVPRDMMPAARKWLAEQFGLSLVTIQLDDPESEEFSGADIRLIGAVEGTLCILGGKSPNLPDTLHAVVAATDKHGMNFDIVHDPHPSGKGLSGYPLHLYFLVPLSYGGNKSAK